MADQAPQLLQIEHEWRPSGGWGGSESGQEIVSSYAPAADVLRQIQSALVSHTELQRTHASIRASIADGTISTSEIDAALAENAEAMTKIRHFLQACQESFPTSMRPTAHSPAKAGEVFSTAELFEAILLLLSPSELLFAARIDRSVLQIFKGSPKLQDRLQLRTRKDDYFRNIFKNHEFSGFQVNVHHTTMAFNQVSVDAFFDARTTLRIGDQCRQMLVVHPPVHSMKVAVSCCGAAHPGSGWGHVGWNHAASNSSAASSAETADEEEELSEAIEDEQDEDSLNAKVNETLEIQCRTGIRIAHIYDATERIRDAHRHCPHAALRDHAGDGTVKPNVTFSTTLTLKKDDPYLIEKDNAEIRGELRHLGNNASAIMKIYVEAKKRHFERGWPILTFEEFRAKHNVNTAVPTSPDWNAASWGSPPQDAW